MTEIVVPVRGTNIYAYVWTNTDAANNLPPVVMVNGGPGLSHSYMINMKIIACGQFGRKVIFYDQAGTGKSTVCPGTPGPGSNPNDCEIPQDKEYVFDLDYYKEELAEVVKATVPEEQKKFHLFSHHFGTIHAIKYAADNPDRLGKIILAGVIANTKEYMDGMWDQTEGCLGILPKAMQRNIRDFESRKAFQDDEYIEIIQDSLNPDFMTRTYPEPDCIVNAALDGNFRVYGRLWGPSVYYIESTVTGNLDLTEELGKITNSVMLMTGEYDISRPPNVRWIKERLIKAKEIFHPKVQGAGHMIMVDAPGEVFVAMQSFLRNE